MMPSCINDFLLYSFKKLACFQSLFSDNFNFSVKFFFQINIQTGYPIETRLFEFNKKINVTINRLPIFQPLSNLLFHFWKEFHSFAGFNPVGNSYSQTFLIFKHN